MTLFPSPICRRGRVADKPRINRDSPYFSLAFARAAAGCIAAPMIRPYLPLNGLRAFEAAARHLSFTKAAIELCVTPAALGHQVKALEERLGVSLFRRLPRGLALTDEGRALLPVLREAFDRMADLLGRFDDGRGRRRRCRGST